MFYHQEGCPHAKVVFEAIHVFQEKESFWQIIPLPATARFPSPTLRIGWEDSFLNFHGKKQALEAIKMLENQVPFS